MLLILTKLPVTLHGTSQILYYLAVMVHVFLNSSINEHHPCHFNLFGIFQGVEDMWGVIGAVLN